MNFKKLVSMLLLVSLAVLSYHAAAGPVSAGMARSAANSFVKSHFKASPGSLKAPATADLVLAHSEPSGKVPRANAYYIFNIKGGGFVIVSGEDHAASVLGYSDKGQIDINNMSEPLQDMLNGYKAEVDYLLTHDVKVPVTFNQSFNDPVAIVEPMTKSEWGPERPYNIQCPMLRGENSKTGCQGTCMSQMLYFWRFPLSCDSFPSYWASRLNAYVPALPATTFNYDIMLLSYSHWDFDLGKVVQDTYTEEQVQEVAKLARYCGQSVQMNYSPAVSTPKGNVLDAMIKFGFNSKAKRVYRVNYTEEAWENLARLELDAGRPIMYIAFGASAASVGHGFILDGYDSENYFHMNMGWYGVNNGWYLLSAIQFVNRFGQDIHYTRDISMALGVEPPLYCLMKTEINASNDLLVLGQSFNPQAVDVNLNMSYRTLPFLFSLTDAQGTEVALSESITLNRLTFENGSDITLSLMLPATLPQGSYDLHFNYRTADGAPLTRVVTASGKLTVVGRFAKYGSPFGIEDVIEAVDSVMNDDSGEVSISDVTSLIDYLLDS